MISDEAKKKISESLMFMVGYAYGKQDLAEELQGLLYHKTFDSSDEGYQRCRKELLDYIAELDVDVETIEQQVKEIWQKL